MATKQAYKKKITLGFVNGSNYTEINTNRIRYIMIEHMYENRIMPVIYMSLSLESTIYSRFIKEKNQAKVYLRVQHYNAYSGSGLYRDDINDQFTYFLSSDAPDYNANLSSVNTNVDSNYKTLTIGLMDMTIMNTMRKTFGGVKKNIDQHTLVYTAIEDTKAIVKTPTHNAQYDSVLIPPLASRKEMLSFLFNKDPFYDTEFLYFVDFNMSYLIDRSGDAVGGNDGSLDTVLIDIRNLTESEAYNEGIEVINGSYYLYINPSSVSLKVNNGTEKIANQLVAVNENDVTIVDLNINNTYDSSTKQTFERYTGSSSVDDAILFKNTTESVSVVLEIMKQDLDSSIITPNMSFTVNNYEGYSDYNGRYMLIYKKEIIMGASSGFVSMLTLGIKRLSNQEASGLASQTVTASGTSKTTKSTATANTYYTNTTSTQSTKKTSSTAK